MLEINTELMRSPSTQRAFRSMMWAILLFMPSQLALAGGRIAVEILPDALGWTVMLLALRSVADLHPVVPRLRALAISGLLLSIPRVVAFQPSRPPSGHVYLAVYVAALAVGALFMWKLCSLIADLAVRADAQSVRDEARWRRWLCVAPVSLFVGGLWAPGKAKLVLGVLFLLVSVCVICLLMGLMASAARMCAHLSRASSERSDPNGAELPRR